MGKKSTRENKNIYQTSREALELTREKASELMEYISADRIEKIESEKCEPHPEEIITMAEVYKNPELPNYFCSKECPIGRKYVPEVKIKDLSQIILEMLASLNVMEKEKNRLIEITVDGVISDDEKKDFENIKSELNDIAKSIYALQLWVDNAIITGKITAD